VEIRCAFRKIRAFLLLDEPTAGMRGHTKPTHRLLKQIKDERKYHSPSRTRHGCGVLIAERINLLSRHPLSKTHPTHQKPPKVREALFGRNPKTPPDAGAGPPPRDSPRFSRINMNTNRFLATAPKPPPNTAPPIFGMEHHAYYGETIVQGFSV